MNNKVVIIGCGNVGMSYAYALINQRTKVNEIVCIDLNKERLIGDIMDLNHGIPFGPSRIKVRMGDYSDCYNASIVCICAGANQAPGETRLDLLKKNNAIFESIIKEVVKSGFDGIFLIATNPVDIMTYITYRHSNFPIGRVIGTGTTLDTARLRHLLGQELGINSRNVHAYVIGEHGDSEFVPWSNALVGTTNIQRLVELEKLEEISDSVKNAAYDIIARKGATHYGIGMVLVRITNAILDDENTVLTVSTYNEELDCFIGTPAIINREGVAKTFPLVLTTSEKELYQRSASILKNEIDNL